MAGKEDKKRKRQSNAAEAPNKRVATESSPSSAIKVHVDNAVGAGPVLLSSPGLTAPKVAFKAYAKAKSGTNVDTQQLFEPNRTDLLLHSSEHPRLDYTASPTNPDEYLSHYVAIFDPALNQLRVLPAHHLNLRSSLRTDNKDDDEKRKRTIAQQRADLGREFGTKKAKKAIADRTVNAIVRGSPGKGATAAESAILDSMTDSALPMLDKEEEVKAALAAKPIPKPDLTAAEASEVYPFDTLVPADDAHLISIKDLQAKARSGEEVEFQHRYPASRFVALGNTDEVLRFKALLYLSLLLEFNDALTGGGKAGKKVPQRPTLQKKLSFWSPDLIDNVRKRFANGNNELPKWHMDNLYTHICALTLLIDGNTTDTTHLKQDLKMENKEIVQYFRELGCKVAQPTEAEKKDLNAWWAGEGKAMNKQVAAATRVAKLRLPLDFPKARNARRK